MQAKNAAPERFSFLKHCLETQDECLYPPVFHISKQPASGREKIPRLHHTSRNIAIFIFSCIFFDISVKILMNLPLFVQNVDFFKQLS